MPPVLSGAVPLSICSRRLSSLDWALANFSFSEATSLRNSSARAGFTAESAVGGAWPQPAEKTNAARARPVPAPVMCPVGFLTIKNVMLNWPPQETGVFPA